MVGADGPGKVEPFRLARKDTSGTKFKESLTRGFAMPNNLEIKRSRKEYTVKNTNNSLLIVSSSSSIVMPHALLTNVLPHFKSNYTKSWFL